MTITYSRLALAPDALLGHQDDSSLEDKEQSQQFDALLHLAQVITGVQPVHCAIHLQLAYVQVYHLTNGNKHSMTITRRRKKHEAG